MRRNAFYGMLKALFVFIFTFLTWLFGYVEKRLDILKRLWVISKFMASQTGQQIVIPHILADDSSSKGNQGMKFDQLINIAREILFILVDPEMGIQ